MDNKYRGNKNRSKRYKTVHGKISGYEYAVKNLKNNTIIINNKKVEGIETPIRISTDGEYLISVQAIDEAGNKSETKSINVYKDEEGPEITKAEITDGTSDGFFIQIGIDGSKEISGLGKLECYVDSVKRGEKEITNPNSTGDTVQAKGLESLTTYRNVIVRVYDNAGNYKDTYPMTGTTLGKLVAPTVEIESGTAGPVGGYYRGNNIVIRVKDNIQTNSGATSIDYTIDGGKTYQELTRTGTATTFTISNEGTYTINAYMKNKGGRSEKSNDLSLILDRTAPRINTFTIGTIYTDSMNFSSTYSDTLSGVRIVDIWYKGPNTNGQMSAWSPQYDKPTSWSGNFRVCSPGTQYELQLRVEDKSGNVGWSEILTRTTNANAPTVTILNNDTWTGPKTVHITGIANNIIMYTTNGTDPSASNGTALSGTGTQSFTINDNCTVKAVYVSGGRVTSPVGQATTTKIDKTSPTFSLSSNNASLSHAKTTWTVSDGQSGPSTLEWRETTSTTWNSVNSERRNRRIHT